MKYATVNKSALDYIWGILVRANNPETITRVLRAPVVCLGRDKATTAVFLSRIAPKLRARRAALADARRERQSVAALLRR